MITACIVGQSDDGIDVHTVFEYGIDPIMVRVTFEEEITWEIGRVVLASGLGKGTEKPPGDIGVYNDGVGYYLTLFPNDPVTNYTIRYPLQAITDFLNSCYNFQIRDGLTDIDALLAGLLSDDWEARMYE